MVANLHGNEGDNNTVVCNCQWILFDSDTNDAHRVQIKTNISLFDLPFSSIFALIYSIPPHPPPFTHTHTHSHTHFLPRTATFGSHPGIFKAVWASGGFANNPGGLSRETEGSEPHPNPSHPHGIPDMGEGTSSGKQDSSSKAFQAQVPSVSDLHFCTV